MSAASEQTKRLAEAAAQRTIDAERRVRDALRELDRQAAAISISFVSVAQRARVSREELAIAHGRVRELELDRRVRHG